MKILAIYGGLRQDSNTNKLVKKIAEASGLDYEIADLGKLEVKPCTGCSECMMNEGKCPIGDDMQGLYEKLLAADGIILGSPTYFMNISGAVKCFIDRSLALFYRGIGPMYDPDMPFMGQRPLSGKCGVVVTTVAGAGHDKTIAELSLCMGESQRLTLVDKIAEAIGMGDVDEMPGVIKRAEAAGKKLGDALRRKAGHPGA
ncbi:MAG: flavodoxin family protein [Pseudomonadota bacterium]